MFILVLLLCCKCTFASEFNMLTLLILIHARVLDFVFSEPLKTLSLCTYWIALIYASVTRFYDISKNSKTERILLRKYYHLMAVVIFLPALILQVRSKQQGILVFSSDLSSYQDYIEICVDHIMTCSRSFLTWHSVQLWQFSWYWKSYE
mgnify:CR=1 FL=1